MRVGDSRRSEKYDRIVQSLKESVDLEDWLLMVIQLFETPEWESSKGVRFDANTGECLAIVWVPDGTPKAYIEDTTSYSYFRFMNEVIHKKLVKMLQDQSLILFINSRYLILEKRRVSVGSSGGGTDYANGFILKSATIGLWKEEFIGP